MSENVAEKLTIGKLVLTPQGYFKLYAIDEEEGSATVEVDYTYLVRYPIDEVRPIPRCTNCGREIIGNFWESADGTFCSDDCGILYCYQGKPIDDDYTVSALAIDAQLDGESAYDTLARLQLEATQRWNKTAREIIVYGKTNA